MNYSTIDTNRITNRYNSNNIKNITKILKLLDKYKYIIVITCFDIMYEYKYYVCIFI